MEYNVSGSCMSANVKTQEQKLNLQNTHIQTVNKKLNFIIEPKNTALKITSSTINATIGYKIINIKSSPSIQLSKINKGLSASCSIICSLGESYGRELFMVKEGLFLLYDGETFSVLKDGL